MSPRFGTRGKVTKSDLRGNVRLFGGQLVKSTIADLMAGGSPAQLDAAPKADRNGPCPCGCGRKAKRCAVRLQEGGP